MGGSTGPSSPVPADDLGVDFADALLGWSEPDAKPELPEPSPPADLAPPADPPVADPPAVADAPANGNGSSNGHDGHPPVPRSLFRITLLPGAAVVGPVAAAGAAETAGPPTTVIGGPVELVDEPAEEPFDDPEYSEAAYREGIGSVMVVLGVIAVIALIVGSLVIFGGHKSNKHLEVTASTSTSTTRHRTTTTDFSESTDTTEGTTASSDTSATTDTTLLDSTTIDTSTSTTIAGTTVPTTPVPTAPPPPPPPPPGVLTMPTSTVDFGPTATTRTVDISNTGGRPISWSAGVAGAGLSVGPTGGSLNPGQHGTLTITLNRAAPPEGTLSGSLTVSSSVGTRNAGITGTIDHDPVITGFNTSPVTLYKKGTPCQTKTVTITVTVTDLTLTSVTLTGAGPDVAMTSIGNHQFSTVLGPYTSFLTMQVKVVARDAAGHTTITPVAKQVTVDHCGGG